MYETVIIDVTGMLNIFNFPEIGPEYLHTFSYYLDEIGNYYCLDDGVYIPTDESPYDEYTLAAKYKWGL